MLTETLKFHFIGATNREFCASAARQIAEHLIGKRWVMRSNNLYKLQSSNDGGLPNVGMEFTLVKGLSGHTEYLRPDELKTLAMEITALSALQGYVAVFSGSDDWVRPKDYVFSIAPVH